MKWTFFVCLTVRRKQTKVWRKLRKCQILLLNCRDYCCDQWILFNFCDILKLLSSITLSVRKIFIDSFQLLVYIFTINNDSSFICPNQIFIVIPIAFAEFYTLHILRHIICSSQLKDKNNKFNNNTWLIQISNSIDFLIWIPICDFVFFHDKSTLNVPLLCVKSWSKCTKTIVWVKEIKKPKISL